jgi:hypothetical protein
LAATRIRSGRGGGALSARAAFAALAAAALLAPAAARSAEVDLTGAWYVLVHYRDARSAQPELPQWEDRLFVFEREGEGLRFRDYPNVRFDNGAGRFERLGGEAARVLAFWEPNEAQRAEIERGLEVDARGATSKLLVRSERGYATAPARTPESLRFVGFETAVELDLAGAAPSLVVSDRLGSAAVASGLQGTTAYRGERVSPDGRTIEGRYARDGRLEGRFRLVRAGPPRGAADPPP